MAEVRTFSSAVDAIVQETGRPELRTKDRIIRYVRQTYRECSALQIFTKDLTENEVTANTDNYVWETPKNFRLMRTVRYPINRYEIQFPPVIPPGKAQRDEGYYYYGGPGYYVFQGIVNGDAVALAYYLWPKHLKYYEAASRPAIYNEDEETDDSVGEWQYLQSDGSYKASDDPGQELSSEQQEGAREKVSNWLIFDWWDTIIEGGAAKVYNFLDDPRAPKAYSNYKSFQKSLTEGEPYDSLER